MDLAFAINDLDWDNVGENQINLLGDYWSNKKNYHFNSCFNLINHIRDRKDFGVIIEVGTEDFLYKTNKRFAARLNELGVYHIYTEYPVGHHFDKFVLRSLFDHIFFMSYKLRNNK